MYDLFPVIQWLSMEIFRFLPSPPTSTISTWWMCVCVYCAIKVDLLLIIHSLYLLLSFNLLSIAIIEEWIVMLHCLIYLLYIYTSTIYYIGINFHTITIAQKLKATYYRDWTRSLVYSIIYLYDRQLFEIALLLNLTLNIFFIVVPIRIV